MAIVKAFLATSAMVLFFHYGRALGDWFFLTSGIEPIDLLGGFLVAMLFTMFYQIFSK